MSMDTPTERERQLEAALLQVPYGRDVLAEINRAALSAPAVEPAPVAQPEPVAWSEAHPAWHAFMEWDEAQPGDPTLQEKFDAIGRAFTAAPPVVQPLTDEQIDALDTFALHSLAPRQRDSVRDFARAVERAIRWQT